ncbi:MAG: DNA polymerase III subunit delta [Candidatus Nealsonbacteria bacterium]|nr:DNA polymerase III subunit delta [Candidatus Nealsonbacteria bacterium]
MIILLYGEDTFRSKKKLQEIIEHYREVHKSGLNLKFFSGEDLSYHDFRSEFQQFSMFQEKKLLVLKNVFSNKEFKDSFLENGKKFIDQKDIIIFYEEGEITPKDSLLKFLTDNAKTQEFKMLGGEKLRNWAQKEFDERGSHIHPEAIYQLVSFVGNNLWQLSNEIEKLSAFKKNRTIEHKDIDLETDIFKTIEAMALRNKREAISLIHSHLEKGDNPLYLLSMIGFQFRNLLVAKKTGRLGGHPYFARKTASMAKGFSLQELKKIYYKIFTATVYSISNFHPNDLENCG